MSYQVINEAGHALVKAWVNGVKFEDQARVQVMNVASLPFIYKHVAVMADVHKGKGATIGSVIPTYGAVIPAAVGSDLSCGMRCVLTSLHADQLPVDLAPIRADVEAVIPHGRTDDGGANDQGSWQTVPQHVANAWAELEPGYREMVEKNGRISHRRPANQLGTLGSSSSNHYVELCIDEQDRVWCTLHSGSRGVGASIANYFIAQAKKDMERYFIKLPDANLAYLVEGTKLFGEYIEAVMWAQKYALANRRLMMEAFVTALHQSKQIPDFTTIDSEMIDCHHNYLAKEHHFHNDVWVTRKGAIRARKGELGYIPGSMGAQNHIVRGKGNPDSFQSASHGAGRAMSRTEARNTFTTADLEKATQGIESRKDKDVIDEIPTAYKDIDAVMKAQQDLVEIVHTLRQVICIKG